MNARAPRQARITDQDLRALISKIDHLTQQTNRILQLLEAEPPRGVRAGTNGARFHPGTGTIGGPPTEELSPVQAAAVAQLERQEAARTTPQEPQK